MSEHFTIAEIVTIILWVAAVAAALAVAFVGYMVWAIRKVH